MVVTPLCSDSSLLPRSSLTCSSASLFDEPSEFSEIGPFVDNSSAVGTLPLVTMQEEEEENDSHDFSEDFFEAFAQAEHVDIDESEHFSTEIELLSEEMQRELSSDSSEIDEEASTPSWVRTASGRPAKLLETAEDEYEKIGLIETLDGEQAYRNQKSYRLSSEMTQRLAMTPSGNYEPGLLQTEVQTEEKPKQSPFTMDANGNFVVVSAMKKDKSSADSKVERHCRFADFGSYEPTKIDRQVTRHTKALYVFQ